MKLSHVLIGVFALTAAQAFSQTVTTPPVGFFKVGAYDSNDNYLGLLGSSETSVSLPMTRPVEFTGMVASISGTTITVSGSTGWTNGQFVYSGSTQPKSYYVLIGSHPTSSPKEGCFFDIVASGSNSIGVDLNGDSLATVSGSTQISIIPHWTLNSIFPASDAGVSFTPTIQLFARKSEVLIPNYSGTGTNIPAAKTYFFYNGAWRLVGATITDDKGNDVIQPNGYFRFRNSNGAPTTTLTLLGSVLTGRVTAPLATLDTGKQDNYATLIRPTKVTLNDTNLISSGAFTPSTQLFNRKDELLVFANNDEIGINKPANLTYFYYNNAWRKVGGDISQDFGADTLPLGGAFIIRKAATTGGTTQFWQNSATY